jgi:hypothetical protein
VYWFFYIVLPLIAAWKKRSGDLLSECFSLYALMAGVFTAVWCEDIVRRSIAALLPREKDAAPWFSAVSMVIICVIAVVVFRKLAEKTVPDDERTFIFPAKTVKFLVPVVVFFRTGLLCAFVFSVLAVTPVVRYLPFVFTDGSLCSGTRYRILWNSFLIDRLSFQKVTVNQRRRAFDRFVPEQSSANQNISMPQKQKGK